jgi:predicted nucleotidyltransferase
VVDPGSRTRLEQAAEELFCDRPVVAAYAYGSRVSGNPRPDSDLDIGYYLENYWLGTTLPIEEEMLLAGRLSQAVGLSVDLRNLGRAPLELRGRVLEEGIRLYSGDPARRVALERDLLGRYHDYKDVFKQMHDMRLRAIAERGI